MIFRASAVSALFRLEWRCSISAGSSSVIVWMASSLSAPPTARLLVEFPHDPDRQSAGHAHIHEMALPPVQPIIPTRKKEPFDDPAWLFEFKYDGFRGLCYLEQGRARLISRNGNTLSRFRALTGQVATKLNVDDAILDGEVIVSDETGRPQFYDLLRRARAPAYVAFDILWLNGTDLMPLPLSERRHVLHTILPAGSPIISGPLAVVGRGCELFELMCAHDLEGIVAKRLTDPYEPRVRWLKIKNRDYTQQVGRVDLFNGSWQRAVQSDTGSAMTPVDEI